jgi:tetratricopeptide (TPR) repeat protein
MAERYHSLMRVFFLIAMAVVISACQLPNPYKPAPPPKQQPAPGGAPTVPSPPPQQPAPVETYPETEPTPPPQPQKSYELGAASRSLVEQAHAQAATGNYAVAASSIERALRIEPNNPLLWIELGQVRQAEGNYVQAENLGRKGLSLATGDPRAQSSAWRLIADALRGRGRAPEAAEAEARANELATR